MRAYRGGLVLAVALVFCSAAGYAGECSRLRIGGASGWQPVTYLNGETQRSEGIASDLARHVGDELGLSVDLDIKMPWKRVLALVDVGRLDMVSAIYWTRARADRYHYTEHFYHNEARVFVQRGREFTFDSLDDLQGRRGGIPAGGSFGEKFDAYVREHGLLLDGLKNKEQMTAKLLAGRIEYFIQDYLDGMSYLRRHDLLEKITVLSMPVSGMKVHMALSRHSPCAALLPEIDGVIRQARVNGTLQTIIDRYLVPER